MKEFDVGDVDAGGFVLPIKVMWAANAPLPSYATAGSAGIDLHADVDCDRQVPVGRRLKFVTGLYVAIPPGYVGLVQPRSGLALNHGIVAVTGVVDSDYRGQIGVVLENRGNDAYTVKPMERIAQLIIVPVMRVIIEPVKHVNDLGFTDRGASGFGSTGR